MSFTSTFPTNIPKFSYTAGPTTVSSIDSATGIDSVSSISRQLFDYGNGSDKSFAKPFSTDLGTGKELSEIGVKTSDKGSGVEKVSYRYIALFESGKGYDLLVKRFIQVFELAKTIETLIPSMHSSLPSALSDVDSCLSSISSIYSEVDYNKEVKTIHFSAVADCALKVASAVGRLLQALRLRLITFPADTYSKLAECWRLSTTYPKLQSTNIIEPEHENQLIDIVACLDSLYSLLKYLLATTLSDSGAGLDTARILDLSPVSDRLTYVNTPIPYYTSQLSPPGGYVLTKPPVTFKTAYVSSLLTSAWGLSLYVKNITQDWTVRWIDKSGANPCAKVSVYSDGWVYAGIEDLCWGSTDWDYDDLNVAVRAEALDGAIYVHVVAIDTSHGDTDQPCVEVKGTTYCGDSVGYYFGSARIVWEIWVRVI
jgi:hypothetical protein